MDPLAYPIQGGDFAGGGGASRALKEQLKKLGADPAVLRRAMIAAYEAEMNVVIHAHGGTLRAAVVDGVLEVEVRDTGPGIADIEQALRPGFSTASAEARQLGFGAGMGLPNIRKSSDEFRIESRVGLGTTIRFHIRLKPQALYGRGRHSVQVDASRCRQSYHCVRACPTQAVRVFRGRPEILDYLCIDCTACIAACPTGTLHGRGAPDVLAQPAGRTLVVAPALLAQFGAGVQPSHVLAALRKAGFADVILTTGWEAALRAAVVECAARPSQPLPVISSACPAVVNLIEMRYPALLPHLAPFAAAPVALREALGERPAVFAVACPAMQTALTGTQFAEQTRIALPADVRALTIEARHMAAHDSRCAKPSRDREGAVLAAAPDPELLVVTGGDHVRALLEEIESGLAGDLRAVEPWWCDQGCFGSPLLGADAYLARRRWDAAPAEADRGEAPPPRAAPNSTPFAPRAGLRLDADMATAVQKLGRIDRLCKRLPGNDCGLCGAPTCATLAEDIVLGRAHARACVRLHGRPPVDEAEQESAP